MASNTWEDSLESIPSWSKCSTHGTPETTSMQVLQVLHSVHLLGPICAPRALHSVLPGPGAGSAGGAPQLAELLGGLSFLRTHSSSLRSAWTRGRAALRGGPERGCSSAELVEPGAGARNRKKGGGRVPSSEDSYGRSSWVVESRWWEGSVLCDGVNFGPLGR